MEWTAAAGLALLGGLLALDETSVGQLMVSRPIVAATLAGWLLGGASTGLMMGATLELFFLSSFPIGGVRFPDAGPASVVAAAVAVSSPGAGGLALGTLMGLVVGDLGGHTVTALRKFNGRWAVTPRDDSVHASAVVRAHLTGVALDFTRGGAVTWGGVLVGSALSLWAGGRWPLDAGDTGALLFVGASVPLGILLASFGGRRRRLILFAAGVAVGTVFAVVR